PHAQHAVLAIERLEHPDPAWNPLGELAARAREFQSCAARIRLIGNRLRYELHDVVRQLARREARAGLGDAADAIGAERAPVLALQIPRHEVPASAGMCEAHRLDLASRLSSGAIRIIDGQLLLVAARSR